MACLANVTYNTLRTVAEDLILPVLPGLRRSSGESEHEHEEFT
jgi:hypothetical protein